MAGHTCPAPGCTTQVPRSQLACRPHWYSIPAPLRNALNEAYRTDGPMSDAHVDAMSACTDFLRSKAAS